MDWDLYDLITLCLFVAPWFFWRRAHLAAESARSAIHWCGCELAFLEGSINGALLYECAMTNADPRTAEWLQGMICTNEGRPCVDTPSDCGCATCALRARVAPVLTLVDEMRLLEWLSEHDNVEALSELRSLTRDSTEPHTDAGRAEGPTRRQVARPPYGDFDRHLRGVIVTARTHRKIRRAIASIKAHGGDKRRYIWTGPDDAN
jgi:hypothetical protein